MRAFCSAVTTSSMVSFGTACTGTDIFAKVFSRLIDYWRLNFAAPIGHLQVVMHCEKNPQKQHFLVSEFDVTLMIPDMQMFSQKKVYNTVTGNSEHLPEVAVFGTGFCCTDISKQNSTRKHNKNNVREKTGNTGCTLEAGLSYIETHRPRLSVLECVPEMENAQEMEDGSYSSDSQMVVTRLEEKEFTVIISRFSCSSYGSRAVRDRWWAIVLDIDPKRWKSQI